MIALYLPVLRWALHHRWSAILVALVAPARGDRRAPARAAGLRVHAVPIREGDALAMPTTLPGISSTEARRTLQIQDRLMKEFPEVDVVLGKIGRADTALDPAPLAMVETHITLYPRGALARTHRRDEDWLEDRAGDALVRGRFGSTRVDGRWSSTRRRRGAPDRADVPRHPDPLDP